MRRIGSFFQVRPGEASLVGWTAALFVVIQTGHGLGANSSDALFFLRFGVEFLPYMILIAGAVVMVAMLGYTAGIGNVGSRRFLPMVAFGLAAILLVERLAISADVRALYAVLWITEQLIIVITFMLMWNAAVEVSDTRQAKRLFPLFAAAGIAGGVVGNFATAPLANTIGTENILFIHVALLAGAGVLAAAVGRRFFHVERREKRTSVLDDLKEGFAQTTRTRLLRLVAWAAVGFSVLFYLVSFPFSETVTASFSNEAEVAGYLGLFAGIATGASLLVSLFVANRLFAWIGIVASVVLLAVVYVLGFGLWVSSLTLATATMVRGAQWVTLNGVSLTAWSSLFNVTPPERKAEVMAFITAVPQQVGVMAAGLLLIVTGGFSNSQKALAGLVLAAGVTVLVWRMRPAYAEALVDALEQGLTDVFTAPSLGMQVPPGDADTVSAIGRALDDPRPGLRRVAVATLGTVGGPAAVSLLTGASRDDDPEVQAAALAALEALDPTSALPVAHELLESPSSSVRREALRVVCRSDWTDRSRLLPLLRDPDPVVRAIAAAVLHKRDVLDAMLGSKPGGEIEAALEALLLWPEGVDESLVLEAANHALPVVRAGAARVMALGDNGHTRRLIEMLDDTSASVRNAAADGLRTRADAQPGVIDVLTTGSSTAQEAALRAIAADDGESHTAVLEWAGRQTDRALELMRLHAELGPPNDDSAAGQYLRRLTSQRASRCQGRALAALETMGAAESMRLVRRGAHSDDRELKAQALEALESVGERNLTRRLIPLLEGDSGAADPRPDQALAELLEDRDPWFRALAAREIGEKLALRWYQLNETVLADGSPLVGEALTGEGEIMVSTVGMLSTMERVLALQQVHMFGDLEPEDLERIAAIAQERRFPSEEMIYRYGDPGDEMLVITQGRVRIAKDVDGEYTTLRTYQAGEHVGELALLRGEPRASDVIADNGEVRGLVIEGTAFKNILSERPEVSLAMLGTIAERLGSII